MFYSSLFSKKQGSQSQATPKPQPTILRFYIIRHGETNENRAGIIQGQLDTKLNETGRRQAQLVAKACSHMPFVKALTSDLERARKTAEAIVAYHPGVVLQLEPGLRERFMGEWEGKKADVGRNRNRNSTTVETSEAFTTRVYQFWKDLISSCITTYGPNAGIISILLVSHGAFIGTLVRALDSFEKMKHGTGIDVRYTRCHNTSITVIEVRVLSDKQETKLLQWANVAHLNHFSPFTSRNADVQ